KGLVEILPQIILALADKGENGRRALGRRAGSGRLDGDFLEDPLTVPLQLPLRGIHDSCDFPGDALDEKKNLRFFSVKLGKKGKRMILRAGPQLGPAVAAELAFGVVFKSTLGALRHRGFSKLKI